MQNLIKNLPPLPSAYAVSIYQEADPGYIADWAYVARGSILNPIDPLLETIMPEFYERVRDYVLAKTGEHMSDDFVIGYAKFIIQNVMLLQGQMNIIDLLFLEKMDDPEPDVPSSEDRKRIVTESLMRISIETFIRRLIAEVLVNSQIDNLLIDFEVEAKIAEDRSFLFDFGEQTLSQEEAVQLRKRHLIYRVESKIKDVGLEQLLIMYKQYYPLEA